MNCNTRQDEELIQKFKSIPHFNCQCPQFKQQTTTISQQTTTISQQTTSFQSTISQQTTSFQSTISQQTPSFQDNFWLWVAIVLLSVLIVAGCFCLGAISFYFYFFQNKNKKKIKFLRADVDKLKCNFRFSVPSKKVIIFCINMYLNFWKTIFLFSEIWRFSVLFPNCSNTNKQNAITPNWIDQF